MRKLIAGLLLVIYTTVAVAGDPTDALTAKFSPQEQILLSGVLADPVQRDEFNKDVQAGATDAAKTKWLARISSFSQDYTAKPHTYNDKASEVRYMVEPAEWSMLMTTLHKLKDGGAMDQAKMNIFISMIDDANKDLARGDPEAGHKVVDTGRKSLNDALKEYLASNDGKAGLAEAARLKAQPATTQPVQQAPVKTPVKQDPGTTGVGTTNPNTAMDQAEKIKQEAEAAARTTNGTTGSPTYDNSVTATGPGQGSTPVQGQGSGKFQSGLTTGPGAGAPNLTSKGPPPPDGDMDELHKMKKEAAGNKTLYATIGGAVLGAGAGIGIALLLGGPIGALMAIVLCGAILGAYGGHALGKKLWG
jgi:hypothetical protein